MPHQLTKQFDTVTLTKMLISAALLIGGTLLTYVSDNLLQLLGAVGIPDNYKPTAVAVFTWLINTGKEWVKGKEA